MPTLIKDGLYGKPDAAQFANKPCQWCGDPRAGSWVRILYMADPDEQAAPAAIHTPLCEECAEMYRRLGRDRIPETPTGPSWDGHEFFGSDTGSW